MSAHLMCPRCPTPQADLFGVGQEAHVPVLDHVEQVRRQAVLEHVRDEHVQDDERDQRVVLGPRVDGGVEEHEAVARPNPEEGRVLLEIE